MTDVRACLRVRWLAGWLIVCIVVSCHVRGLVDTAAAPPYDTSLRTVDSVGGENGERGEAGQWTVMVSDGK